MKGAKGIAAAVVLTLGVFVAAIPPASIDARADAAPFATDEPGPQMPDGPDIVPGDDDSDNADAMTTTGDLAQQQEEDDVAAAADQDEERAQPSSRPLQQMEQSEQRPNSRTKRPATDAAGRTTGPVRPATRAQ
jgi:hypothetical protein